MTFPRDTLIVLFLASAASAQEKSALDEFKVKRQEIFEFAEKPTVSRNGDRVEISFTAKARCDVTIVIEDREGKIVRHLVSGVLGDKAPFPLKKDSLKQSVVWDGKDDKGNYVNDMDAVTVRVSLGLKASFEKSLFWEPKRRSQQEATCMQAAPEGVYTYDGRVLDHVRLFDHDGQYLRTIYPFPADKIKEVKGLHWHRFPHDSVELPLKEGFHQATLLSSGTNGGFDPKLGIGIDLFNNDHGSVWGNAASVMAVRDKHLALARLRLNRLATDGSTGGLELGGPPVTIAVGTGRRNETTYIAPRSAAFSPDGKTLYLTGYVQTQTASATKDIVLIKSYDWIPCVMRLDYAEGKEVTLFAGGTKLADAGSGSKQFKTPTSLAVDSVGRIYVSDFVNDRIQVFNPDGELLKSIATLSPAQVSIHQKTQEIYVFSWNIPAGTHIREDRLKPLSSLTVLRSFADPKPLLTCPLTLGPMPYRGKGSPYRAELDSWSNPPRVWLSTEWSQLDITTRDRIKHTNVTVYTLEDGKLKLLRDFNEDVKKSVVRTEAAEYARQRLYVDPATGMLYVGEGHAAAGKSFSSAVRIDPESGKIEIVQLPFDAEDMCFDIDGLAYLRTFYLVARYHPKNWREVPWDYGEENNDVRTSSSREAKPCKAASVLRLPVKSAGLHHHGGMAVSPRGNLVVAVNNYGQQPTNRKDIYETPVEQAGKPYVPPLFPGRVRWGEIHVWDKHGQILYEDAIPGLNRTDGLGIDRDDNLYVLSTTTRVLDGKRYFNDMTGTLMRVPPKKNRLLSPSDTAAVPLPADSKPARAPDLSNSHVGNAWMEGAEWFYGGVGFCGKNAPRSGGGCDCWNTRFTLDFLNRSFAPEIDRCGVTVLDSSGNVILRIGRYGNADTAGPKSLVPLDGDGVGLFYAPYVATHTDKRLFIADPGNGRIVSVRLDYHVTERTALKNAARKE